MPDYDPIVTSRRYVLAEDDAGFGIWARDGDDEPIERYPGTEEGFDAAEDRFRELKQLARWGGDVVPRALVLAILGGAAIWIFGIVLQLAYFVLPWGFEQDDASTVSQILYYVDTFAFRAAIGGVVALAGLLLARRLGASEDPTDAAQPLPPGRSVAETLLGVVLAVGLASWVVAGTIASALEPRYPAQGLVDPRPSGLALWAAGIEGIAFRIWTASVVVLGVRWVARLGGRGRAIAADG